MAASSKASARSTDPFAALWALGARHVRMGFAVGLVGALLVHGSAAGHGFAVNDWVRVKAFALSVHSDVLARVKFFSIEIEEEPPEPEKEEPPPEPEKEELPPEEPPPAVKPPPLKAPEPNPPPPAAAEAGKVLTSEPDPNAPLDLTGNVGFVTGNAESYAGGITATTGKSKKPVYDRNARADGEPGSKTEPTKPIVKAGPSLARPANVIGGSRSWKCPFPAEADVQQINYRRVEIVIMVTPEGKASNVQVLKNGHDGFGDNAIACARRKSYTPALDDAGKPISGTLKLNINFQR